ncbi:polysaccharide deacetylase family protein [Halorussus marinus]|uniref:polysaccharide deacetylase family protein n=1 Tax=Halorussus marinus TaxID=2505976 RepID=UPI001FCE7275|nr:polysaccharide deacetylase family protein [Halorussus marinus]
MLSFDLEHWHSATLLSSALEDPVDRIEESVDIVLNLLRKHGVTATFFVVGEVAEEYPDLIDRVRSEGHEIGSHGHTHTPLFELSPAAFETELERSSGAIERATGVEPEGFRAPNFSVTRETEWAFDVLESAGFRYDSSVFPVKTPMYGVPDAPRRPYTVPVDDPFRIGSNREALRSLVESPLAAIGSVLRLPIAGGFYGRVLPERLLKWGIRRLNRRGIPANLYFHPWEFNPAIEVESLRPHKRFVSFHGVEGLESKLDGLLSAFSFNTARSVLEQEALLDSGGSDVERAVGANDLE